MRQRVFIVETWANLSLKSRLTISVFMVKADFDKYVRELSVSATYYTTCTAPLFKHGERP